MEAEQRKPAQAFHLAELIREEMGERGWTITDLVMHMGPHYSEREWQITHLSWEMFLACADADKDVLLGDKMAQQLADAFDVDPQFFMNFHDAWRKARNS